LLDVGKCVVKGVIEDDVNKVKEVDGYFEAGEKGLRV
jgi:hypothetical protein